LHHRLRSMADAREEAVLSLDGSELLQ
jgi:hypothetical protein